MKKERGSLEAFGAREVVETLEEVVLDLPAQMSRLASAGRRSPRLPDRRRSAGTDSPRRW